MLGLDEGVTFIIVWYIKPVCPYIHAYFNLALVVISFVVHIKALNILKTEVQIQTVLNVQACGILSFITYNYWRQ
jgi:hypothetical protein